MSISNISTTGNTDYYIDIYAGKEISSNIPGFTYSWDYISKGGKKSPTYLNMEKAVFISNGQEIGRKFEAGEQQKSNMVLARLAIQVFESQLDKLTEDERRSLKTDATPQHIGLWNDKNEQRLQWGNGNNAGKKQSSEYFADMYLGNGYPRNRNGKYYFYNAGLMDSIEMAQNLLKKFGTSDDQHFRVFVSQSDNFRKSNQDSVVTSETINIEEFEAPVNYTNPYCNDLIESKNIIFRGAPGTGKTYLAKEVATNVISKGRYSDYTELTAEQKKQVEFVQFHPSYDYTDFVEGLRPKTNADGSVGFELQDGVFKKFVALAKKNFDNSQKSQEVIEREASVQELIADYFSNIELVTDELETARGTIFYITSIDEKHINISIPENNVSDKLSLNMNELREMLESGQKFTQVKDVTHFFGKLNATQHYSYYLTIFNAINSRKMHISKPVVTHERVKPYIFIIDEINRGEISKIFGELFFSIDPGYRGKKGEVSTQYANLHDELEEKFYIPENVFIIGTMNDIDRSVDSFDFAMRRRFRFIEIQANEHIGMLDTLDEDKGKAIKRMKSLNEEISKVDELDENYHIGASYFLKLKELSPPKLWDDYLSPLLRDYVRGMYDEEKIMKDFEDAFWSADSVTGDVDDGNQA